MQYHTVQGQFILPIPAQRDQPRCTRVPSPVNQDPSRGTEDTWLCHPFTWQVRNRGENSEFL